ncbi:MAG: L-seryl-tRNA(Sec) selenium transferase [Calditrichaeota bacterium]|nr:L-seryl-tRNA(Sec) selenium transferase [Calditrichota bacterium]
MADSPNLLAKLPPVHVLLNRLESEFPELKPEIVKRFAQSYLEQIRRNPQDFNLQNKTRSELEEQIFESLSFRIRNMLEGSLKKVINATGVVLHTGLGRSPLNPELIKNLSSVSRYCNLEIDLESGKRGQRNEHLSFLLQLLSGAEDGFAVNNNAAAVMLMLNTFGYGKEVILSRSEMIEIGGSFRMPEVMLSSGCILKEIGTTNKTHLKDYEEAVNENTGAILICHPSNYAVQGFTHKPDLKEIVSLAHRHNIPLIYDLGSGSTEETSKLFGGEEPEINAIVRAGADLVSFSGDKLLGGPQAGIIVGKRKYVEQCANNHLLRALRLDKLMIKILQLILTQYLYRNASDRLEAHRALLADEKSLKERCERFYYMLPAAMQPFFKITKASGKVGSGAYPLLKLPSAVLRLNIPKVTAKHISDKLRKNDVPVITYIDDEEVVIDLRTVPEDEESLLLDILVKTLSAFVG